MKKVYFLQFCRLIFLRKADSHLAQRDFKLYVAKDGLELHIPLPLFPKCWSTSMPGLWTAGVWTQGSECASQGLLSTKPQFQPPLRLSFKNWFKSLVLFFFFFFRICQTILKKPEGSHEETHGIIRKNRSYSYSQAAISLPIMWITYLKRNLSRKVEISQVIFQKALVTYWL